MREIMETVKLRSCEVMAVIINDSGETRTSVFTIPHPVRTDTDRTKQRLLRELKDYLPANEKPIFIKSIKNHIEVFSISRADIYERGIPVTTTNEVENEEVNNNED